MLLAINCHKRLKEAAKANAKFKGERTLMEGFEPEFLVKTFLTVSRLFSQGMLIFKKALQESSFAKKLLLGKFFIQKVPLRTVGSSSRSQQSLQQFCRTECYSECSRRNLSASDANVGVYWPSIWTNCHGLRCFPFIVYTVLHSSNV